MQLKQACHDIFQSERAITKEQRARVERACNEDSTNVKVSRCLQDMLDITPADNPKQCNFICLSVVRFMCFFLELHFFQIEFLYTTRRYPLLW